MAMWTDLEIGVGIICGCLPTCRALVGYLFPTLKMALFPSNVAATRNYPSHSISHIRHGSMHTEVSIQSFIEQDDRTGSQDSLEPGTSLQANIYHP
jgi:hypothetical protein